MFIMNLQLFGGRGGASGGKRKPIIPFKKFTTRQLGLMSKSQLATVAKAIFINKNTGNGLSAAQAARRFDLLVGGNTAPQLRKYIRKNQ